MQQLSRVSLSAALCLSLLGSTPLSMMCDAAPNTSPPQPAQWLAANGKPWLGVSTKDVRSTNGMRGVLVESVDDTTSPLKVGDVLVSLDGVAIADAAALDSHLAKKTIGEAAKAKVIRGGKETELKLVVLSLEEPAAAVTQSAATSDKSKSSLPTVKLGAATELKLVLEETVSSNKSKAKDTINYSVQDDVKGPDGTVLILRGAKAGGTVTVAKGAGGFGRKGKLEFTAEWVETVDGQRAVLRTTQAASGKGQQGVAVATFLFLSILGGFIKGKNATVNKGTVIPAFIDRDIEVVPATP